MDGERDDAGSTMPDVEVAIVGSGFAGLCAAIKLKQAGIDDLVILEKETVFGGTWRVNHYPGAACDIPSHLYSFSFAQNPDWRRKYPRQAELLAYTEAIVRDHALAPHLRLATAVLSADFDEALGRWRVRTNRGRFEARVVIIATGALSTPSLPPLPGLATFAGKVFHSARWDLDYDLNGKRVAVVGTGASAIQFLPEIVGRVRHMDVYQRTAPWVLPRPDRAITDGERWLLRHCPPARWLYRALTYARHEARFLAFARARCLMGVVEWDARRQLRRQLPHDAVLRAQLTPHYRAGCKRLLLSSDYYPIFARSNVTLVTAGIAEVRAGSIVARDGTERPVDAIIFGTGFDVQHTLQGIDLRGRDGIRLADIAAHGLEAYKGAALAGFPNLFLVAGPNTGLGHNSMVLMIEANVRYVVDAICAMRARRWHSVEVRAHASRRYNDALQRRLRGTVWNAGCKSWYLTSTGKNNTLWPGFTFDYMRITRRFDAQAYDVRVR